MTDTSDRTFSSEPGFRRDVPQSPPSAPAVPGARRAASPSVPASGPVRPPDPRAATAPPTRPRMAMPPVSGPAAPPAVTRQMYLPPVAPPGWAPGPVEAAAPPPGRWGWRALLAFVVGGLLTALGFVVGSVDDDDRPELATTPTTVVAPPPTAGQAPSIVVEPPDIDTTEPVAFVAQVLGPSVVQVEIPDLGLGSGVVIDDGLILTNHHVVEGATDGVDIRTSDGRVLDGEVVGSDARTDIAVVSVGPGSGLPVAQLAKGETLEVGQVAVAIGSPFQLQQTVTSGIISALDRPVFNGVGWNPMIQTDAAINQGNSGGALADRIGRVIGINTAIRTDGISTGNVGVGFAVPIDTALGIADRILAGEELSAGFLGVSGVQPEDGSPGVLVDDVTVASAADEAGIMIGDRIVTIDDAPVTSIEELAGLVQTRFPGDEVELEVVRDGELLRITARLGER